MTFGKTGGNHRVNRFSNDRSGAALVEFALIGSMLLFSILFVVEVGLTHLTTLQLEQATNSMARVVRTGRTDEFKLLNIDGTEDTQDADAKAEDKLTEEDVKTYVCRRLIFAIDCTNNARIFIRSAKSFNGIAVLESIVDPFGTEEDDPLQAPDADNSLQAPGPEDYVIVTVFFRSPLSIFGNSYDLRAATVVRNEPFG